MLPSAILESIIPAIVVAIALVAAIAVALKLLAPVNAATRALIWSAALIGLPIIQGLYLFSHVPSPPQVITREIPSHLPPTSAPRAIRPVSSAPLTITPAPLKPLVNVPTPHNFAAGILGLYAVIVAFLMGRLALSYLRLRLLKRRSYAAPIELSARMTHWLARCPTARPVRLRLSDQARSPMAIGWFRPILVMPAALVLEIAQQDFDNLGVHELAHIRRYDDWANLFQRILTAILFFHPASHYINRRLNLDREIACDDWVVSDRESKSYARSLAKVVELRHYQRGALLLSSGAFFGKRQILKRVETLLDKTRNSATRVSGFTLAASLLILAAIASQVAHLPAVVAFTQEESDGTHIRISDGSRNLRISYRGDIVFSPDEQSIIGISPDGYLAVDESKDWSHRRLEVRSGIAGKPEQKYFLDGREKQLDGVGSAWAAASYLFILRETGLDADARVGRLLARRGPGGVLQEIDLIHSDQVKLEYLNHLLEQATLNTADFRRLADSACKLSGDNEKADFLLAHQRDFLTDDLRTSYFRAVNSIRSDEDRRRVLKSILDSDGNSPATARLVGLSARSMNSDNEKADVLRAMPPAASAETHCALLKAAATIQSDDEKAKVLQDSGFSDSAACRQDYFAVLNLIQSDNDRANVLQAVLKNANLEPASYRDIANSAKAINSDDEKANVLAALAPEYSDDPFFDAANSLRSDNDLARILQIVVQRHPQKSVLLQAINSTVRINADDEKTGILVQIAKQSSEPEIRLALQQVCQKLNSDTDYRRVASALFEASNNVNQTQQ